jgi:hypothetical protein
VLDLKRQFFSIRRVLRATREYESARVGLMGFLDARSQENAIYVTRAARDAHDVTQGVALPRGLAPVALDGRCVFVEGFFAPRDPARGGFSGELGDVLRIEAWADAREPDPPPPPVPDGCIEVGSVVADPEALDGERVAIFGYAVRELENQALFPSEEAYRHLLFKDAVWTACALPPFLNHKYVSLRGALDSAKQGHRDLFACELRDTIVLGVHGGALAAAPSAAAPSAGAEVALPDLFPMPRAKR